MSTMILFTLTVAIIYNNNLCYLVAFGLTGIFLSSLLFTHLNLKNVHVEIEQIHSNFVGSEVVLIFTLVSRENKKKYNFHLALPDHKKQEIGTTSMILPNDRNTIQIKIIPSQRGVYHVDRIKIYTEYPFGFFRAWVWWPIYGRYHAYPQPLGEEKFRNFYAYYQMAGEGFDDQGDDFSGHKRYERGDSLRRMDCRALAREQDVLAKVFSGGGAVRYIFRWNDLFNLPENERKLSQLSLWVLEAFKRQIPFEIHLPERELSERGGQVEISDYLKALAEFDGP
ncbi:MAG: DUF58 domain-containing protein [Pseudomonadota bacterium]